MILNLILAITVPITATTKATKSLNVSAYHGESITFETTFLDHENNAISDGITSRELYYQTNGMGQVWFKAKSDTTFTPADDCGAENYRFFIRAEGADGVNYRANGNLRMLDSPGFTPAKLDLPVKTIDFSQVETRNAPWALTDDLDTLRTDTQKEISTAKQTATEAKNTATTAKNKADYAAMEAESAQSMARGASAAADAAANQSSGALGAISLINENIDTKITPAINSNAKQITTISQILEGKNFRITVSNVTDRLALATFEVVSSNGWREIWNETNAIEEAKIELKNDIKSNYYTKTQNDDITKATRKWSRYDSTTGEAAPDGFTQISSKHGIILGADLGYLNVQGSDYWVLSGNGNINVSTNGMISICDSSGKAVFRSVKGDAQLKGAIPGAFSIQKNVSGKDIITIGYLFTASVKPPRMEFSNALEPSEVNWIKDTDEGAPFTAVWDGATCTVTLDADSKGFFRAFYYSGGESYVESTQPMSVVDLRIGGKKVGTTTINGKTVLILEDN